MVLDGGSDTHLFYVEGGCHVANHGQKSAGLAGKSASGRIGLLVKSSIIAVGCLTVGLDANCVSQGGFLSLE